MKLISGANGSGFYAYSANSAAIATNDDLGRKISETYLTAVDLSPYATTAQVDTVSSILSAGLDYVSANAGADVEFAGRNGYISAINSSAISASVGPFIRKGDNVGDADFTLNWGNQSTKYSSSGLSALGECWGYADVIVTTYNGGSSATTHKLTEKLDTTAYNQFSYTAGTGINSALLTAGIISVTGEFGKTYTGESPIVVNNTTDKISLDTTNTWSLSAGTNMSIDEVGKTLVFNAQGGGSNFAAEGSFFNNDDETVEKNLSGIGFYEQANYRGSYQVLGSANDGTWHGYGYTMSLPEGVLLSDINASASTYALSAVSSLVRPMVYADITFSAVRDTFKAGGVVIPYEVNQGYSIVYDYVGSSVNGSYSSYNFHNLQFNGYGTVLTISSFNDGATTGVLKHSDRYFASPSDVAAVDRIVLVPTSGDIPASGSSDNKVYIVTGTV